MRASTIARQFVSEPDLWVFVGMNAESSNHSASRTANVRIAFSMMVSVKSPLDANVLGLRAEGEHHSATHPEKYQMTRTAE
jgi:hypothetical protein